MSNRFRMIFHLGNTANNAFYNATILRQEVEAQVVVNRTAHAISHPLWEFQDFKVRTQRFLNRPRFISERKQLQELLGPSVSYVDASGFPPIIKTGIEERSHVELLIAITVLKVMRALGSVSKRAGSSFRFFRKRLHGTRVASLFRPLVSCFKLVRSKLMTLGNGGTRILTLAKARSSLRSKFLEFVGLNAFFESKLKQRESILITYGAAVTYPRAPLHNVVVEHGTLRWASSDSSQSAAGFRQLLKSCDHLWVTNLDERTLSLADELTPDRWQPLPHPFLVGGGPQIAAKPGERDKLKSNLASDLLLFMPSSINWAPDHNKGSNLALEAFFELRKGGYAVGLILTRWGRDVEKAQKLIASAGLADNVLWVNPLLRIPMQRLMASVDLVLDQFGLDAFGALSLRAMDQGVPLISAPINEYAISLIGETFPWMGAISTEQIISSILDAHESSDWPRKRAKLAAKQSSWLVRRHHHLITRNLQVERYKDLVEGNKSANKYAWAMHPDVF